jgi:hypothetical protein
MHSIRPLRFPYSLFLTVALLAAACSGDPPARPRPDASTDSGAEAEAAATPESGVPEAAPQVDAPIGDAPAEAHAEASVDPPADARHGGGLRYPQLLSETGLFADVESGRLAPGVRRFEPRYVLWSDGATKRRWVYLPEGSTIDTSDMDFWVYPEGTKVWKEFSRDGKRVETRMLHKAGPTPDEWVMIAYEWREDLTDAVAVPLGVENAGGTEHDIPAADACLFCHGNVKDRLLGFTALQLSHDLPGPNLMALGNEGFLSVVPEAPFVLPGDELAQDALGYLHANCGDCHNPTSEVFRTLPMELWESTKTLGSVEETSGYRTAVDLPVPGADVNRIVPGHPESSMVVARMNLRGNGQMPPIATEHVHPAGLALVSAWIRSLAPGDGGDAGERDAGERDAGDSAAE